MDRSATNEFVYSGSFWEPGLAYAGNQEFVAAYETEFNHAPSNQSAGNYAGCQLLVDAIRRTGGLLTLKTQTVFGDFAVDERGYQIAHRFVTSQWQDGKRSWFGPAPWRRVKRGSRRRCVSMR